jgi:hypothetical protein
MGRQALQSGHGKAKRIWPRANFGVLDAADGAGHPCCVMRPLLIACLFLTGLARGQSAAPADVTASAAAAVDKLGKEVVQGHFQIAIDRMYPKWKERMAKQMGGMDKLQSKLDSVGKTMAQQGMTLLSFGPAGTPTSFEVWPGKKIETVNGQQVETLVYEKWMILIPTKKVFRIVQAAKDGQPAQSYNITSEGFQIAVADKGKNDWTFIDGSGVTIPDLRSMFLSLPENLVLPEIKRSGEAK